MTVSHNFSYFIYFIEDITTKPDRNHKKEKIIKNDHHYISNSEENYTADKVTIKRSYFCDRRKDSDDDGEENCLSKTDKLQCKKESYRFDSGIYSFLMKEIIH